MLWRTPGSERQRPSWKASWACVTSIDISPRTFPNQRRPWRPWLGPRSHPVYRRLRTQPSPHLKTFGTHHCAHRYWHCQRTIGSSLLMWTRAPIMSGVPSSCQNRVKCFILSDTGAEDSLLQSTITPQWTANALSSCGLSSSWATSLTGNGSPSERITKHQARSMSRPIQADAWRDGAFASPNVHRTCFTNEVRRTTFLTSCRVPSRWHCQKVYTMI